MGENLSIALQISLIGMGLVFSAIVVLWGLMGLLVRVTSDRPPEAANLIPEPIELPAGLNDESSRRQHAAAAAVAYALAHQASRARRPRFPLPATALVSAWQAVNRASNLRAQGRKVR
jgi:Na+-transporting methylmalonyl-CoA/oxaloacetate decarboxylase gamma subunit